MLWLRDYYLPALLHRQYPDSFQTGAKSSGTDKLVSTQSTLTSDINKRRKLVASVGKAFCTPAIIFSRNATTAGQVPTPTRKIILRYDSEYAAKSVLGIWNGKKNTELIRTIRAYYREVQAMLERSNKEMKETKMLDPSSTLMPISLTFEHVKGHSNDRWNDLADELANRGAKGRTCVAGRYIN